jgi:ComF family protein
MRGFWLCEYCEEATLPLDLPGMCARCGEPTVHHQCGCGDLPGVIRRARAFAVYDGWVAASVRRVKYEGEPDRARHLAELMAPSLGTFGHVDGLVPVPLHPAKQKARGFNQSSLLAKGLSEMTGIPTMDILRRTKNTASQTTLSSRERKQNVIDAFQMEPTWHPSPGKRYVLIDDVRTTGSTLSACAEALAVASPVAIGVLTFALDMPRDELQAYRDHIRQVRRGATPTP